MHNCFRVRQFNLLGFLSRFFLFSLLAFVLAGCESRRVIVNGLDEREANEILVFLESKQVDATKIQSASDSGGGAKTVSWNISVDNSQASEAMALLNQAGLPRKKSQNLLNIFSNQGLVPSGMGEKIRYQAGLAEQIASTIRKIDGVLDADVQVSFPEEDPLNPGANKQKITASVYVKHNGILDDPNAHLVSRIKRLVAGAVNGLDYDNVTVIGDRARFADSAGDAASLNEQERPYVNVWSLIIAQTSLLRFRLIFFSFTLLILLLVVVLLWLLWKFLPILSRAGGVKALFSIKPLQIEPEVEKIENPEKQEEESSEEEEK